MSGSKSSGVAIVLSLIWTGLGQLYAGRTGRGVAMMLATPLIWSISFASGCAGVFWVAGTTSGGTPSDSVVQSPGGAALGVLTAVLFLLPVVWWVWGMGDAKRQCDAVNQGRS